MNSTSEFTGTPIAITSNNIPSITISFEDTYKGIWSIDTYTGFCYRRVVNSNNSRTSFILTGTTIGGRENIFMTAEPTSTEENEFMRGTLKDLSKYLMHKDSYGEGVIQHNSIKLKLRR